MQAIRPGFPNPVYVNETGAIYAIRPGVYVNETNAPGGVVVAPEADMLIYIKRRRR